MMPRVRVAFTRTIRYAIGLALVLALASFAAGLFTLDQSLLLRALAVVPLAVSASLIFVPHQALGRKLMLVVCLVALCSVCWWIGAKTTTHLLKGQAVRACEKGHRQFRVLWYSFQIETETARKLGSYHIVCAYRAPNSTYVVYVIQEGSRLFAQLVD